jgi:hypothetical protein
MIHSDALDWYRSFFLRTLRSPRPLRVLDTTLDLCEQGCISKICQTYRVDVGFLD